MGRRELYSTAKRVEYALSLGFRELVRRGHDVDDTDDGSTRWAMREHGRRWGEELAASRKGEVYSESESRKGVEWLLEGIARTNTGRGWDAPDPSRVT